NQESDTRRARIFCAPGIPLPERLIGGFAISRVAVKGARAELGKSGSLRRRETFPPLPETPQSGSRPVLLRRSGDRSPWSDPRSVERRSLPLPRSRSGHCRG